MVASEDEIRDVRMARAGHLDFKATQSHIDLAGETFRKEARRHLSVPPFR
jgi:hypothetical protein